MRRSKRQATMRRFHQLPYRAREWSRSRKLVARVEATDMGTDVRFIVTNLEGRGKVLYEKVYYARGRMGGTVGRGYQLGGLKSSAFRTRTTKHYRPDHSPRFRLSAKPASLTRRCQR